MTRQKFWPYRMLDEIMFHCSSYGLGGSEAAISSAEEIEFKIFNGREGESFTFGIGIVVDSHSSSDFVAAVAQPFDIQDGFGWLKSPTDIPNWVPPDLPHFGGGGSRYYRYGLTVKLFRPDEDSPFHIWDFDNESTPGEREFMFPLTTDVNGNPTFPVPTKPGWWRCRVSHKASENAHIAFWSMSFLDRVIVYPMTVSYRWLNQTFENVMGGITPRVSIDNHHVEAGILEEVSSAAGITPITFTKDIDEISGDSELIAVNAIATRGSSMKADLKSEMDRRIAKILSTFPSGEANLLIAETTKRFNRGIEAIGDADPVVKINPVFSDPKVKFASYHIDGEFDFGNFPLIYINFSLPFNLPQCFVDLNYGIGGLGPGEQIAIAAYNAGKKVYDFLTLSDSSDVFPELNDMVAKAISANGESIRKYMLLALGKVAGKSVVIDQFQATQWGWELTYYSYKLPDPDYVPPPPITGHNLDNTHINTQGTGGVFVDPDTDIPPVDPAYGVFPDDYRVTDEGSLERLDKVKTIFVIMMENRSFDHFLGFLSREMTPSNDASYITFPDNFTNPPVENLVTPIRVRKASEMGWTSVFVTPVSPEHEYNHVLKQISDGKGTPDKIGAMQGFTTDIMERFNEHTPPLPHHPGMVMSYYEKEQLPTYFEFAKNFKVLDQWFAAHPGPTWPNRIATVTGELLGLRNFSLTKDDRLGYFDKHTIFDTLTDYGIDWLYMESNVGILRLFNKYRADDIHVVPLKETDEYTLSENHISKNHQYSGLQLLLSRNTLPRVVFIDPRFSDLPPLRKACDDLAPTHVGHGQWFLYDVYSRIRNSPHWKDSAILITYDEHGGYFDHVPPPGTSFSTTDKFPKIYQDEPNEPSPDFLGVRVPAFLISPYVKERSVSHVIFDHTSIVKTILVHNRERIPRDGFELFGKRVRQAEHFGVALDLNEPRDNVPPIPEPFPDDKYKVVDSGLSSFYTRDPNNTNDFGETLRTLFIPNVAKS